MANKKITELTELIAAGDNDVLPIVDLVAVETKKIKVSGLKSSLNLQRSDVGLSNVDNTSDINKPISSQTQVALNAKANSTDVYTKIESNANFEPKNSNIQSHILSTSNPHGVTKSQIGLANVPDVNATQRSNHTGTQTASTISDLNDAINSLINQGANIQITYNGVSLSIAAKYKTVRERSVYGLISTGSNNIVTLLIPTAGVITQVKAFCKSAPIGSDLVIDILKNGASIFPTAGDRLTIQSTLQNSTVGSFAANLSVNDTLDIDVVSVGSGFAGDTLNIVLEVEHG